jgi:gamma-carbonic anhydrase
MLEVLSRRLPFQVAVPASGVPEVKPAVALPRWKERRTSGCTTTNLTKVLNIMIEQKAAVSWPSFLHRQPQLAPSVFVVRSADIIGAVSIAEDSSVWFQVVIRADINEIRIGRRSNIQDGSILHVADDYPVRIGDDVTCGHRAVIHACQVNDRVLVGMGAIILDGAEIGSDSIIGAHTLVTKGTEIPPGSLVVGSPGKVVRSLKPEEIAFLPKMAAKYVAVAAAHRRLTPSTPGAPTTPGTSPAGDR